MRKNHRAAFAADPKFQARIARLQAPQTFVALTDNPPSHVESKKPSKAVARARKVREANMDGRKDFVRTSSVTGALTFVFPGAMLLGLNQMLRMHDASATGLKLTWFERIKAVVLENREMIAAWRSSVTFPVLAEEVYVTGENSLLDSESVVASCKPIIDSLVRTGVLPDDSPKYVSQPLPYTERGGSPALSISFRPHPKPWGHIDDETVMCVRAASSKQAR